MDEAEGQHAVHVQGALELEAQVLPVRQLHADVAEGRGQVGRDHTIAPLEALDKIRHLLELEGQPGYAEVLVELLSKN